MNFLDDQESSHSSCGILIEFSVSFDRFVCFPPKCPVLDLLENSETNSDVTRPASSQLVLRSVAGKTDHLSGLTLKASAVFRLL